MTSQISTSEWRVWHTPFSSPSLFFCACSTSLYYYEGIPLRLLKSVTIETGDINKTIAIISKLLEERLTNNWQLKLPLK